MEPLTDTWVTAPVHKQPESGKRRACLVQIYPTDAGMGSRHELGAVTLVIGRGEDCEITTPEQSVSRRHALIEPSSSGGYLISDLKSTNGTFVNDEPVTTTAKLIHDGDYVRVGNCIFRFLAGGNVEAMYHEEIYRMTILDGLTQVHNQRYMLEFLDREIIRAIRHKRPLSLVLFDVDFFKAVNDKLGHLVGDFTLRELAFLVRQVIRREDLLARYGGEEFALVLVEADREEATEIAERIRVMIEQHTFSFDNQSFQITISCGVADCSENPSGTVQGLIKRADEKLFEAKRAGRNRVVT